MSFLDVAVLGTARQQGETPVTGTPLDPLVDALALPERERNVLLRAGSLAVYRRAGSRPRTDVERPAAAPPDRLPVPPPAAVRLLADLIAGGEKDLLREALERLARASWRLPPVLLPAALSLLDKRLRGAAAPVLDERGRWLARFRPEWAWALHTAAGEPGVEDERVWLEGAFPERVAALARVRGLDAPHAREWLDLVWAQEAAERRADLLVTLEAGLSGDDEVFLERVLDDRSQLVRAAAAALLAKLPGSGLGRRMVQRADGLLSYSAATGAWARVKSRIRVAPAGVLAVTPPKAIDKSWERDGISAKPPKGLGERAHWLAGVLSLIPPAHWVKRLGAAPADLVAAAWAGDWGFPVTLGWSRAAALHRAAPWAGALWDGWRGATLKGMQASVQREMLLALLPVMARQDAEARALALIDDAAAAAPVGLREVLELLPAPWSEDAARAYLDALAERDTLSDTVTVAALGLPPTCFARALELPQDAPAEGGASRRKHIQTFTAIVELRRRLHEEIPA